MSLRQAIVNVEEMRAHEEAMEQLASLLERAWALMTTPSMPDDWRAARKAIIEEFSGRQMLQAIDELLGALREERVKALISRLRDQGSL